MQLGGHWDDEDDEGQVCRTGSAGSLQRGGPPATMLPVLHGLPVSVVCSEEVRAVNFKIER